MKTETALLGSLTIPGQAEHVAEARAFVSRTLGADCPEADTVILLTSELVTNSIQHSQSGTRRRNDHHHPDRRPGRHPR